MNMVSAAAPKLLMVHTSSLPSRWRTVSRSVPSMVPHHFVIKSQADKDGSELPPSQSSPQQTVMDEARRVLQHQRQSDPNYAALPTLFGRAESSAQIHADTLQRSLEARHEAFGHEIGADELQVCLGLLHLLPASSAVEIAPWTLPGH